MRVVVAILLILLATVGIVSGLEDVYTHETSVGSNTVYFNKTYDTNYINNITITTYPSNNYYKTLTIQAEESITGRTAVRANITLEPGMNSDYSNIEFIDGDGNILNYYAAETSWLYNDSRRIFYIDAPIVNGSEITMRWGENISNKSNASVLIFKDNIASGLQTYRNSSWFRNMSDAYEYSYNALDAGLYHAPSTVSSGATTLTIYSFYNTASNSSDRNILTVGGPRGTDSLIWCLPNSSYAGGYNVLKGNISTNSNSGYYMPEISIISYGNKTSLDIWFTANNSSVNLSAISQEYIPPESHFNKTSNQSNYMSAFGRYDNLTSLKYMYIYRSSPHTIIYSDVHTESVAADPIIQSIDIPRNQKIDQITFNSNVMGSSNININFEPYVLPLTENNSTQEPSIQLAYYANPALTQTEFKVSVDPSDDLIFASGTGVNGSFNATIPPEILSAGYFENTVYWAIKYTNNSWSPWNLLNIVEPAPPASNITINIYNESNPTSQINATVNLSNESHFITKSGESVSFNESQITEGQYLAQVTAPGFLPRYYVITAPGSYNIYMANESNDYALIDFQLIDNTGFFPPSSTKLIVKSNSGVGELLISSRYFNVAGASSLPLLVGSYYTLTLQNESGFEKSLGFLIPTASETIRLIVGDIINTDLDPYGNFSYTIDKNPENITLTWNAGDALTPLNLTITALNGNAEPFQFSTRAPSGSSVYLLPDLNVTYKIEFTATANGKTISETLYYTPTKQIIDTSFISETTQNAICLFVLLVLCLLVSPVNVKIGSLLVVGTATAMFAMGFLHIAFVIIAWVAFIGFAAIFMNPFVR